MSNQETTPDGLAKSVFIYTVGGTIAFIATVIGYVFLS